MKIFNNVKKVLKLIMDSDYRFIVLSNLGFFSSMTDEEFLKKKFKTYLKYDLNLTNPQTFNEKLQWLKLYDRNPDYTFMVDKYKVRDYVKNVIGEEYLIPLLGCWSTPEEINFAQLPDQFVLKCNHNSGKGMCICIDKAMLNLKKVRKNLQKGLNENYYYIGREWPYKNVQKRIIAEKYMVDGSEGELKDYKLMCFNGKVKCTFVCTDRFSKKGLSVTFFDNDWNMLPFERHYRKSDNDIPKPYNFEKMKRFAEMFSKDIPFLRVDFYEINKKLYFGELTFFPGSGFEEFTPFEWDVELGNWLDLSNIKKFF